MTLTTHSPPVRRSGRIAGPSPRDDLALLAAAWKVLERSGYRSLKIRQVLDASGCSASAFYRRFPSKAHLVLALMRAESERTTRDVAERLAELDDPRLELSHWLRFHVTVLYDPRRRSRALMFSDPEFVSALPGPVQERRVGLQRLLAGIARRGVEAGHFRTLDADADADAVYRMVRGLVYDPFSPPPDVPAAVTLRRMENAALRLLGGESRDLAPERPRG